MAAALLRAVVGIVGDVKLLGPVTEAPDALYHPYRQSGPVMDAFKAYPRAIVVRVDGQTAAAVVPVRKVLAAAPE